MSTAMKQAFDKAMVELQKDLARADERIVLLERVVTAARAVVSHWNEFGHEYGMDEDIAALAKMIEGLN